MLVFALVTQMTEALQQPYQLAFHSEIASGWDMYLSITWEVQQQINIVLGHNMPYWWALNSCPCCQYKVCHINPHNITTDSFKLMDEPHLKYHQISIIDGITSLWWIDQCELSSKLTLKSDYFLSVDEVNKVVMPGASHQVCFGRPLTI